MFSSVNSGQRAQMQAIFNHAKDLPHPHMAISTSNSMRCNIAFLPNGACLPSWARPTGQVSQLVSASPYNTAIVFFKVYLSIYINTAPRVELSLRLLPRKGQPAVSTVYISPDNIVVIKHIKIILKFYALVLCTKLSLI